MPAQTVLPGFAVILTAGVIVALVNFTPFPFTDAVAKHGVAFDVITTFTESFATGELNT